MRLNLIKSQRGKVLFTIDSESIPMAIYILSSLNTAYAGRTFGFLMRWNFAKCVASPTTRGVLSHLLLAGNAMAFLE